MVCNVRMHCTILQWPVVPFSQHMFFLIIILDPASVISTILTQPIKRTFYDILMLSIPLCIINRIKL
jgi:hypothetical protein